MHQVKVRLTLKYERLYETRAIPYTHSEKVTKLSQNGPVENYSYNSAAFNVRML